MTGSYHTFKALSVSRRTDRTAGKRLSGVWFCPPELRARLWSESPWQKPLRKSEIRLEGSTVGKNKESKWSAAAVGCSTAATLWPHVRCVHLLFYLRSCSQRRAQRVLHGLRQDGGALSGHHRHQAAVLGEKHGQVGTTASAADAITCTHSTETFNDWSKTVSSAFLTVFTFFKVIYTFITRN